MGLHFRQDVTYERLREVLTYDPETGLFRWLRNSGKARYGDIAGSLDHHGYVRVWLDGKQYAAARLAWLYMTGEWPAGVVDHIDPPHSNNRWSNLRQAESWQNAHNRIVPRKRSDPSIPPGVQERYGRYRAMICINGERTVLGIFDTKEEAGRAYEEAAKKYAGEFSHVYRHKTAPIDWKTRALEAEARLAELTGTEPLSSPVVPNPENGGSNG